MTENSFSMDEYDRRQYLKKLAAMGALGTTGLAGCTGDGGGGGGSPTDTSGGTATSPQGQTGNTLEVIHGWVGGDGANAIQALEEAFAEEHPDVPKSFKGVGASANVSLNSTITRRLANRNPMSSFANWPGQNLKRYKGRLGDYEKSVWEAASLKGPMMDAAVKQHKFNGKMPGVPIGSHRMNNLFYNISVFEEAGVDAKSLDSVDALIDALDAIKKNTDKAPMAQAMKAPWTNLQLFAQILTSMEGVKTYMNFINGNPDKAALKRALKKEKTILKNYINTDASSVGFTTANQKLIAGDAGCIHQGNWVYGMYRSDDQFNYKKQWDWVPFPGTEGIYFFHLDSFMAPKNNPSPENTVTWLKFVGSKKAQVTFNNPKGSVPLRTDIKPSRLTDFLALTYKDLRESTQRPPTIAHGLAVTPKQLGDAKSAFSNNFMGPFDVDKTANALVNAVTS